MNISETNKFGTLSLVNFARKHAERLASHSAPAVAARAAVIAAGTGELEQSYAACRPLCALWSSAAQAKDLADEALDETIQAISYELLGPGLLNGDRQSPRYRSLFLDGTIAFIHGPDRAELARVAAMVGVLEADPTHPAAHHAVRLKEKAAALEAALGPVTAAETAYRAAQAIERDKRQALQRMLRKSVTFLRDQLDDEVAVERLFPTIAEARVPEEAVEA